MQDTDTYEPEAPESGPTMADLMDALDELNGKMDVLITFVKSVQEGVEGFSSNPMLRMMPGMSQALAAFRPTTVVTPDVPEPKVSTAYPARPAWAVPDMDRDGFGA